MVVKKNHRMAPERRVVSLECVLSTGRIRSGTWQLQSDRNPGEGARRASSLCSSHRDQVRPRRPATRPKLEMKENSDEIVSSGKLGVADCLWFRTFFDSDLCDVSIMCHLRQSVLLSDPGGSIRGTKTEEIVCHEDISYFDNFLWFACLGVRRARTRRRN